MSAPPYMKLYIADYHGDTTHLDCREHGAYLLLLMAMWRAGGKLPADDAKLAKLAKLSEGEWAAIRDSVLPFFQRRGGRLSHKRIAREIAKYEDTSVKRREAAKASGSKKPKENKLEAEAFAEQNDSICTHNQNQNQNHISIVPPNGETIGGTPPDIDPDKEAWDAGAIVLVAQGGMTMQAARTFFGGLLKRHALEPRDLLGAIGECKANRTKDPQSYLAAAAKSRARRRFDPSQPQKRVGWV